MVDDVVHLVGREFMQNRNGHATISECGKKSYGPVCTVATGECYFVTLHDAAVFKHDVEFLYLPCNVVILKCCTLKVGQGILVPVVYNRLLYQTIEMLCLIHNLVFAFNSFIVACRFFWDVFCEAPCTNPKILCKDSAFFAHSKTLCALNWLFYS